MWTPFWSSPKSPVPALAPSRVAARSQGDCAQVLVDKHLKRNAGGGMPLTPGLEPGLEDVALFEAAAAKWHGDLQIYPRCQADDMDEPVSWTVIAGA